MTEEQTKAAMSKVAAGKTPTTTTATATAIETTTTTPDTIKEASAKANIQKKVTELKTRHPQKTDKEISEMLKTGKEPAPDNQDEQPIDELLNTYTKGKYKNIRDLMTLAERPQKTLDEYLKEKNQKYSSIDKLIEQAERNPYASERIAKLNELEAKGVDITNLLKFQATGYEKLDPANLDDAKKLLAMELRISEPDITEKEIAFELKNRFTLEVDEDAEESEKEKVELSIIKLQRQAKKAKETLTAKAKELELPQPNYKEEADKQFNEFKRQWSESVNQSLKNFDGIETSTGEGKEKFNYKFTDNEKIDLAAIMNKAGAITDRYVKDGKTDMDMFRQDMAWLANRESILKSIIEQSRSEGQEEILNKFSNLSIETTGGAANQSPKSPAQRMAEKMKANGLV